MTSGKTISENMKKIRTKIGLTKTIWPRKRILSVQPLTKFESGVVNKPSVQMMVRIAKALSVSIED